MPFQHVVLLTDWLVYALVVVIAVTAWYVRGKEHLRAPWRRVAHSKSGMVGLTVLLVFVAVGLIDSVHFRPRIEMAGRAAKPAYAVDVLSLLDVVCESLRARREKTYSAPLAAFAYAKETLELPDGGQVRDFPRLVYGGKHLKDPEKEWAADVARRALAGVAAGAIGWFALVALVCAWLARKLERSIDEAWRALWAGETDVPWHAILTTCAVMLLVAGPAAVLASQYHLFGTDKVGQDVLYQALKSIRTGLVIGTLTTLVMLPFAIALGIAAGYFGGWVDDAIQYVYSTLNSIPGVLLIAAVVLMTQVYVDTHPELFPTTAQRADIRLLFLCLILGVTEWTGLCRLLRGETLKLKQLEYIQAALAFGVRDHRIMLRHILPNVMHIVLIVVVMDFSGLVLAEAVLSYVGVGVDPSMISFGTMINNARLEMAREPMVWWSLAAAFCFMLLLVLAANLFADAVRDAFDPRTRVRPLSGERLRRLAAAAPPAARGAGAAA
ncbi:MAG TPA: ABC transporter permease [Burkholderiales bacterium]|nr:ABC transporter permease [Burkholderiales bacterium]